MADGSQIAKLILYLFGKFGKFLIDFGMVGTNSLRERTLSGASAELVVVRFRNISTAMIERPNRYSNTSWNAAKKTNGNKIQIVFPGLRPNVIINQ